MPKIEGSCYCVSCKMVFKGWYNENAMTDDKGNHASECADCLDRKARARRRR